jgi:hypothetical protein
MEVDKREFRIFAAYFLINEAMEHAEDEFLFEGLSDVFLEKRILTEKMISDISDRWDTCSILKDRKKIPLIKSAFWCLTVEIDSIGPIYGRPWMLDDDYFVFVKEYIMKLDKALRFILIESFIYAPFCSDKCWKECKKHCNNKCNWGKGSGGSVACISYFKHENIESDESLEEVT